MFEVTVIRIAGTMGGNPLRMLGVFSRSACEHRSVKMNRKWIRTEGGREMRTDRVRF